jgi:prophage regulatory protein
MLLERILRRDEVETVTGLKRSTIYDAMKSGSFPAPLKLTARAVGWPESTILEWIASRKTTRKDHKQNS